MALQVLFSYVSVKNQISAELKQLEHTIDAGLSQAIWELNDPQIEAIGQILLSENLKYLGITANANLQNYGRNSLLELKSFLKQQDLDNIYLSDWPSKNQIETKMKMRARRKKSAVHIKWTDFCLSTVNQSSNKFFFSFLNVFFSLLVWHIYKYIYSFFCIGSNFFSFLIIFFSSCLFFSSSFFFYFLKNTTTEK